MYNFTKNKLLDKHIWYSRYLPRELRRVWLTVIRTRTLTQIYLKYFCLCGATFITDLYSLTWTAPHGKISTSQVKRHSEKISWAMPINSKQNRPRPLKQLRNLLHNHTHDVSKFVWECLKTKIFSILTKTIWCASFRQECITTFFLPLSAKLFLI